MIDINNPWYRTRNGLYVKNLRYLGDSFIHCIQGQLEGLKEVFTWTKTGKFYCYAELHELDLIEISPGSHGRPFEEGSNYADVGWAGATA